MTINVNRIDRNSVTSLSKMWLSSNRFSKNKKKSINISGHLYRIILKSNYNEDKTKQFVMPVIKYGFDCIYFHEPHYYSMVLHEKYS